MACASTPPQWAGDVRVNSAFVGLCPDPGNPSSQQWSEYASWGAKWVRQGFFWSEVEPQRHVWHWEWTDRYVRRANERGLKVLAVLDYSVPWFQSLNDYLTYVRAVVHRYRGRVAGYEIWNEPNLGTFWRGSRQDYVKMASAALSVIGEEDPGALTVVGALSLVPLDWLEALQQGGLLARADFLSIHAYGLNAEASLQEVDQALAFLRGHRDKARLMITEVGYPTGGWYPTAGSPSVQANRLLRFYAGSAARGVEAVFWYTSRDQVASRNQAWNSEAFFGLQTAQGQAKPALDAYTLVASILPGSRVVKVPLLNAKKAQDWHRLSFRKDKKLYEFYLLNGDKQVLPLGPGCTVLWPRHPKLTQGGILAPPWAVVVLRAGP